MTSTTAGYAQFSLRGGNRTFDGATRASQGTRTGGTSRSGANSFSTQTLSDAGREGIDGSLERLSSGETTHTVNRIQSAKDPRLSVRDVTRGEARSGQGKLDVTPRSVVDTSRSDEKSSASNSERTAVIVPSSRLKVTDGEYDFLRVVSADQLGAFPVPSDGAVVVLPRRNFLIADKELSENEQKKIARPPLSDSSKLPNSTGNKSRTSAVEQ
ncbi:MAG: hypothetical protein J6X44_12315 [Thermoguttaceae bacterium]|nr:hypothetical protein [Thermoguttaceae bacterium]